MTGQLTELQNDYIIIITFFIKLTVNKIFIRIPKLAKSSVRKLENEFS